MARVVLTQVKTTYLKHNVVLKLVDDFINDSYSGRRLTKKGVRIKASTIENYFILRRLLTEFCATYNFHLRIYNYDNLTSGQRNNATRWYLKFYRKFTQFLYGDKKYFDNYVGLVIRILRSFFGYIELDRGITFGPFIRFFHVPKEEIPIIALRPDQLQYIIHSHEFTEILDEKLLEVKDIFVFGCTVALRVSDLLRLTIKNLSIRHGDYYVSVKSEKTGTRTSIKLPPYAKEIIIKYENLYPTLLPPISIAWLNALLKKFAKQLPEDIVMPKIRERRGEPFIVYKNAITKEHFRLSDHICTHTMRRTAITTMLTLGVSEHIVRQISGHSANSKSFHRYVQLSQEFMDNETDRAFDKLCTWNPYNQKSIFRK